MITDVTIGTLDFTEVPDGAEFVNNGCLP